MTADWTEESIEIPFPKAEIYFLLKDGFNGQELVPALTALGAHGITSSLEAANKMDALLAYFKTILEHPRSFGKPDKSIKPYFRLDLAITQEGSSLSFSFPEHKSFSSIKSLLEKMIGGEDGFILSDIDEGWSMEILRKNGWIFMLEGDGADNIYANGKMRCDILAAVCRETLDRTQAIIDYLEQQTGEKRW